MKLIAQSKHCDKLVEKGDTIICQDFTRKGKLFREHVYVNGKYDFTRRWHYRKNGEFECLYQKSKGAFAKQNGPAFAFYSNGILKASTFFEHGHKIGPCKYYYPSGKIKRKCQHHINGNLDGIHTDFFENGQLHSKARWEKGRLQEILAYKDENGTDLYVGSFKDGNGTWIWTEIGKAPMVFTYRNGRLVNKKRLKN